MKNTQQSYYCIFNSPIGKLLLIGKENSLEQLRFENTWNQEDLAGLTRNESIFTKTTSQLNDYFKGLRKSFSLIAEPKGTAFQKSVWRELQNIPYGKTASYGEIAKKINNPKGCRAVGLANGKNPIPIIIPCHRVIGKNGKLTGFGGGIAAKKHLLNLESSTLNDLK